MSYDARVLKIMIASPGDVAPERHIARQVITDWNTVYSEERRLVLMPVSWETHASPEMGDHPQTIINKQILRDCDLLIAMFWTRLGSPTESAPSGTVEEIEEHVAAGKPALVYFSNAPVRMDSVDEQQYEALLAFKESMKNRGLFFEYGDTSDFREQLTRHLPQTVLRKFTEHPSADEEEILGVVSAPSISNEAQRLLREASKDPHGIILKTETMAGTFVQVNGQQFTQPDESRSEALWRAAINELIRAGLIEDRRGEGSLFYVTDAGYFAADALPARD
jgi:hypothetical protein